jgi:uncharacterized protein (TIGR02594 family)
MKPKWIEIAERLIGTREIPGPANNKRILSLWQRIRVTWFSDETTPWCGAFVGYCMAEAGFSVPKPGVIGRALAWADYGTRCAPQVGAIGVKRRSGGGHVFFIVGQSPDRAFFKALGGNQGDAVSIIDIRKSDVIAVRWPPGAPAGGGELPVLQAGARGVRED